MFTSTSRQILSSATLFVFAAAFGSAQNIAPAHSGTVDYFDGDVTVNGAKLVSQVARFTDMKEQSELHTGLGRAEILLTPGVLLRVGENTTIKMLDNRLMSTRVEFISGTAMLESDDSSSSIKDPAVTIIYKDFQAQPLRNGLFEMTSQPSQVRVFRGEAKVIGNDTSVNVKEGNQVDLTTTMASAKFDAKVGDDLYLWSRDRSAYLSAANMSSARTLAASGYGNGMGYGSGLGYGNGLGYGGMGYGMGGYAYNGWDPAMWTGFSGGWYYNPYLNMYSYLPFAGTMYSPFGYGFFNPVTIASVYAPGYYWTGAGGSRTGTTAGVALSSLPVAGRATGAPLLPRLGASSLRAPMSAPLRGAEPALSARNPFAGAETRSPSLSSSSVASSGGGSVRSAAPSAVSASPSRGGSGRR